MIEVKQWVPRPGGERTAFFTPEEGITVEVRPTDEDQNDRALKIARNLAFATERKLREEARTSRPEGPEIFPAEVVAEIRRAIADGEPGVLLIGAPGVGKTLLARRVVEWLPDTVVIESVRNYQFRAYASAGLTSYDNPYPPERPFRAPHHTVSEAGLTSNSGSPFRGEASLAHGGVLMLDELAEFHRATIGRLADHLRLSAPLQGSPFLVAAVTPCPCGYHEAGVRECRCPQQVIASHKARVDAYTKLLRIRTRIVLSAPDAVSK